jgi:hypothetical protein
LEVKAEDDYALSRFVLYKALAPYRQHGISELQGKSRTQVLVRSYDTAALGLSPGDKLELRAEVGDENPFRFNIVSTPTTIVHVISEEEYAAVGSRSGRKFVLGDRVRIKVKGADLRLKQLDFEMVGSYDAKGAWWPIKNEEESPYDYSKRGRREARKRR